MRQARRLTGRNLTMTENIEALGAWLANAGVDPDATTIPMPARIPPENWWQVKNHARAMLLERLPERQRQLLVLLYAEVCDEIVASAVEEAENKRR
jgi:hypothetical protein